MANIFDESKALDLLRGLFVHRMSLWLGLSLVLVLAIGYLARHMLGVLGFKLALLTMAGYLGYWISRAIERGQRPHELRDEAQRLRDHPEEIEHSFERAWQLEQLAANISMRRTTIVAACLIASALGG